MSRSLAKKTTRLAAVALALVVVGGASGCGDEDEVTTGAAEDTGTSTVEAAPAAGKPGTTPTP
jgi:hypothetical protein